MSLFVVMRGRVVKSVLRRSAIALALLWAPGPAYAQPAWVGPEGYATGFSALPPAGEWSTYGYPGSPANVYDLTYLVQSLAASTIRSNLVDRSPADPAPAGTLAFWTSGGGGYVCTRPAGNRCTLLMVTLLNNTGTNATGARLEYDLAIKAPQTEPDYPGWRAFYSLSGESNSWVAIPELSSASPVAGRLTAELSLGTPWMQDHALFVLWADDNANIAQAEPGYALDNFFAGVTVGVPHSTSLACLVDAPGNQAVVVSGVPPMTAATVFQGTPPYTVEYFTNSGAGNTEFVSAGSSATAPYRVSLGSLPVGTYQIYAAVTDSAPTPARATSATNTFRATDPVLVTLTAPAQDATFDYRNRVEGAATVSGGTPPYAVQFYLDNVPHGAPVTTEPYTHDFGFLVPGARAIQATARDARGWVSNSWVHTVHVIGPLAVTLTPPHGALYDYGQSLTLTAAVSYGTAPHTVSFYTNDQLAGSVSTPPYTWNLGVLPVGSYTGRVHVVDSAAPTPEQADSGTNVVTIQFNPVLLSRGSTWRYLDTGANLSNAWSAPDFDDTSWAAGRAELGYGDSADGRPEATVVSYGPSASSKFITTYFRRTFPVAKAAGYTNLYARFLVDDGAVIYLNGVEVSRYNLPSGRVSHQTLAISAIGGSDEAAYFWSRRINPALLVDGANCLAVEVHQNSATSSDLSFDLELLGNIASPDRAFPLAAGQRGTVRCADVPEKSYDVYLPPAYTANGTPLPVVFTFHPDGGGMVGAFQNVGASLNLILVGILEARNSLSWVDYGDALHAVFRDVRERIHLDPTAVFAAGFSGGAVESFECSRIFGQQVAGIISMGGWLGYQTNEYTSRLRVRTNLLVARLTGDGDAAANYFLGPDAVVLRSYGAVVQDWAFSGGHQVAPDPAKTLALTWLLNQRIPAGTSDRTNALTLAASWRSRLAAGETEAVLRECLNTLMAKPRTWESFCADGVMDEVQANFSTFRRIDLADLAGGDFAQDYFYYRACLAGACRALDLYYASLKALTGVTNHNGDQVSRIPNALASYGTPAPLILAAASDASGHVELLFSKDSLALNYLVERRTEAASGSWAPVTALEFNRGRSVWSLNVPTDGVTPVYFRLQAIAE